MISDVARNTSTGGLPHQAVLRSSAVGIGGGLAIIGGVMAVVGLLTPVALVRLVIEVGLSVAVLASGLMLLRTGLGHKQAIGISVIPGEIALAGALVYLGVTMPPFQNHQVAYGYALTQFMSVVAGLVFGAIALILAGGSAVTPPSGREIVFGAVVRDGVLLIVGTILLAIALGQLGANALQPPKWNWISFLGITIPGMLILVVREAVKGGARRCLLRGETPSLAWIVGVELMLLAGLAIALYGSIANLVLGANGFLFGFKVNLAGIGLWAAAAFFLLAVRGSFDRMFAEGMRPLAPQLVSKLLYALGALAFIVGERSVITGKDPAVSVGAAAPVAVTILAAGLVVLIAGRILARRTRA